MKVWLVGVCDVEMTNVRHVCLSEKTALMRWEEIRQELIQECKDSIEYLNKEYPNGCMTDVNERMLKNLTATNDPEKMDNYPQDEPFMYCMEAEK